MTIDNQDGPNGQSDIPAAAPEEPTLLMRQRQLSESAGYRALALMDRVKRIAYIFQANVRQYKDLVAKLQNPGVALSILDVRTPSAHDELLSEAERLLHNVLTSMTTRVDQQRVFMNKYFSEDAGFTTEYRKNVDSLFVGDLTVAFLKCLRHHITHHQLPVAQSRETLSNESFSITFVLPSAPLLKWNWDSGVKGWIERQGDAIPIVDIVDSYASKVGDFDKWLYNRIRVKYASEIQEFEQAQEEYVREYDRVFGF